MGGVHCNTMSNLKKTLVSILFTLKACVCVRLHVCSYVCMCRRMDRLVD